MAGDQSVLVNLGADSVRGDGPVAQPGHQHQAVLGNILDQPGQLRCHCLNRAGKDPLLPAGQALQRQGDIAPPGLAQSVFPPLVQHLDGIHRDSLPEAVPGLHPRQGGDRSGLLLPQLSGLQGQVGTAHAHGAPSFYTICCGIFFLSALVSAAFEKLSRSGNFFEKTVDFFRRECYNTNLRGCIVT